MYKKEIFPVKRRDLFFTIYNNIYVLFSLFQL